MKKLTILVTGSRDWTNLQVIVNALHEVLDSSFASRAALLHGGCPTGADALADHWWRARFGADSITVMRADWNMGRNAGLERNKRMVETEPDVVLAFVRPCRKESCGQRSLHGSHGTLHTVRLAHLRQIPVQVFRDGFTDSTVRDLHARQ